MITPHDILDYWYGDLSLDDAELLKSRGRWWFMSGPEVDEEIRARFADTLQAAERGELDHWTETAEGHLALIIVLDQFSRNIYRGKGDSFQNDARALELARTGVANQVHSKLRPAFQVFFLMPYMHSEEQTVQVESVELFAALRDAHEGALAQSLAGNYEFAVRHKKVIDEFGRYPHRNGLLGRANTAAEQAFLDAGKSF